MSTTAPPGPATAPDPRPRPARRPTPVLFRVLRPIASLQLSVVLFAIATALVFFGTVAMMQKGLWTVVDEYFRSALVWVPFELFRKWGTIFLDMPKDAEPWVGSFPFPGGWLIGGVMLANLLAAHIVRFKFSWKRSGIVILHAGMVALMLGELVTGLYAVESTMTLKIGEKADFVDASREFEIAVVDHADPKIDKYVCVPQGMIERPGVVRDERLPFVLEVVEYWPNTEFDLLKRPPTDGRVLPSPMGWFRFAKKGEGAGVDGQAPVDTPSVVVKAVHSKTGASLGEYFLSALEYPNFALNHRRFPLPEQSVTVDGKAYGIGLRNQRIYKPYEIELKRFEHGKYPGTDIPRDFASTVLVKDQRDDDPVEVRVWMNNPLRHQGDSLYQHETLTSDSGTVLQVVRNPGRIIPYASCVMVTLGMLVHFGIRLNGFLAKRAA